MKNEFIAKKCNLDGTNGYQFEQYHDGHRVVSQFIPKINFAAFLVAAEIDKSDIKFEN